MISGQVHTFVALEDEFTLGVEDIVVNPQTGIPIHQWAIDSTIRNKVDLFYDFNVPGLRMDDYGRRQVYTADQSIIKYGTQPAVRMQFRGLRTEDNAQEIMDRLALSFLQRWGYPPPFLRLSLFYRRHILEILDSVRVTHPLLRNPITGTMGLDREQFEIIDLSPAWLTEGKIEALLLWTGAIETSAAPTTTGGLALVPGVGSTDDTDYEVPFEGSVDLTTEAGITAMQLRLKSSSMRRWQAQIQRRRFVVTTCPDGSCANHSQTYVQRTYVTAVTYRVEFKTNEAPDEPGSGAPTTGWVELIPTTTRGTVGVANEELCQNPPVEAEGPDEDVWIEARDLGAPSIYNLRVHFEAIVTQANPWPNSAAVATLCRPGGGSCEDGKGGVHQLPLCNSTLIGSASLLADEFGLTVDALTSIS